MARAALRLAALVAGLACGPADAGEWLVGAGVDDFDGEDPAPSLAIEVRGDPLLSLGSFGLGLGAAAEADLDADLWAGGGLVAALSSGAWRLGASVMPGLYARGDGNDLGDTFEIRSQVFVDRRVSASGRLGVAFEHKSNAALAPHNPGVETMLLTYSRLF